jgi:hypothetical protein
MEKRKRKSEKLSAVQKRHSRARAQTMAGSPDDFEEVG